MAAMGWQLRHRCTLCVALLATYLFASTARAEGHRVFGIYALWFAGSGDEDREQIDRFLDCLVNGCQWDASSQTCSE